MSEGVGIERPKLRNQRSITNQNSLTYVLLNLRVQQRKHSQAAAEGQPPEHVSVLTA
jgi:hypothetical protein